MRASTKRVLRDAIKIVLLTVIASVRPLAAQSDGPQHPAAHTMDSSWPEVNLNVVVLNKKGTPEKVDKGEFELFEDGLRRPFDFRNSADSAVSIAILIDTSGSMFDHLGQVKTFVTELTKALPDADEVMIARFADASLTVTSFTPASVIDLSFIDGLHYWGPSNVYDSIVVAERYFATHARYARRALVLISDGDDNASHSRLEDVIRSLQWPGAPTFYSLNLQNRYEDYADVRRSRVELERLSKAGGGIAFAPNPKEIASTAAHIADIIHSQYILQFAAGDTERDGKAHKLEVRLPDKTLKVFALPVCYAPTQ